jgi:hypothetical protein
MQRGERKILRERKKREIENNVAEFSSSQILAKNLGRKYVVQWKPLNLITDNVINQSK